MNNCFLYIVWFITWLLIVKLYNCKPSRNCCWYLPKCVHEALHHENCLFLPLLLLFLTGRIVETWEFLRSRDINNVNTQDIEPVPSLPHTMKCLLVSNLSSLRSSNTNSWQILTHFTSKYKLKSTRFCALKFIQNSWVQSSPLEYKLLFSKVVRRNSDSN